MSARRTIGWTGTLALALAGCGGGGETPADTPSAAGGASPAASAKPATAWAPDSAELAKLGDERPVLGGRYVTRVPAGLELEPRSTDDLVAFKRGADELMYQAEAGIPKRVTAEQYITDNRKMMGLQTTDYPGFQGGEIESGAREPDPHLRGDPQAPRGAGARGRRPSKPGDARARVRRAARARRHNRLTPPPRRAADHADDLRRPVRPPVSRPLVVAQS